MTQQTSFEGMLPPPKTATGLYEWMQKAWVFLNQLLQGKTNNTYPGFTLEANADQTTLNDFRIGGSTVITFTPKTANAAAALSTLIYGDPVNGAVNIGHANNAQTDRTFDLTFHG